MKKYIMISIMVLTFISTPALADGSVARVHVNGLVCDFCARALEKVFARQEAVENIDVDLERKVISVHFKSGQNIVDEKLAKLIIDSGYDVEEIVRDE